MAHWRGVLIGAGLIIVLGLLALIVYLATKQGVTAPSAVANPTWTCQDSYANATGAVVGNFTLHLCSFGPTRYLRIIADDTIDDHAFVVFQADTIAADDLPAFDVEKDGPIQTLTGYFDIGTNASASNAIQVAFSIFDDGSALIGTTQYGASGLEAIAVTEFAASLDATAFQGITTTLSWLATFNQGPPVTVAPIVVGIPKPKVAKAQKYADKHATKKR